MFGFLEQGDQHDALQPVHRHLLQPWPAAAPAMKQAPGLGRRAGQGGEQVGVQGSECVWVHR